MVYQGSKQRFIQQIKPFIQEALVERNAYAYVEPFVGGANAICEIEWPIRYGYDAVYHLVAFLQRMQDPTPIPLMVPTREEYYWLLEMNRQYTREDRSIEPWVYGYIYTVASFSGVYRGGYGQDAIRPDEIESRWRNVINQAQKPNFDKIIFGWSDFKLLKPYNCVVYLDPPYDKTRKYRTMRFDYQTFLNWIDKIAKHNTVFLSEYTNPDPEKWETVWTSGVFKSGLNGKSEKKERCELLLRYRQKKD